MGIITRVYDTYVEARRAVDAVNALGLPGVEASVLGNESLTEAHRDYERGDMVTADTTSGTATGAGVGATIGGGAGLLAGLGMLAIPGLGPVVAAGWLAATAVGVVGGAAAGGAVGALTDLGLSDDEAPVYTEALRRGSVLVSIRFPDDSRDDVEEALDDVPMVPIDRRREAYLAEGWRADDIEGERSRDIKSSYIPPTM